MNISDRDDWSLRDAKHKCCCIRSASRSAEYLSDSRDVNGIIGRPDQRFQNSDKAHILQCSDQQCQIHHRIPEEYGLFIRNYSLIDMKPGLRIIMIANGSRLLPVFRF